LEAMVGRDVRKPEGYLLLTSVYAQKKDAERVEKTLREGITFNEKSASLYLALADLCLKTKRTDEAVVLMQKVVALEPEAARYRLILAGIYWNSGKEKQAADVLTSFTSADPKKEERWVQAAEFYGSRNRPAEAEQMLKEGISRNGKSFRIRFVLGALYLSTNRPDQAIAVLHECLGLEKDGANPNIIHAKNSLAQIYLARQETGKAKKYVDEVLKESPKNLDANYLNGTIHLRKQEGLPAVSSFRTVIGENPQFIPGYISLAEAHAVNKEMGLAFDTLREALKVAPDSRDVIRATARLYGVQKDFKNAEVQYRRLLDANPKDMEVRADLGDLMLKAGDFARAESEYGAIKKLAPNHPMGYIKLSACYVAQHKWDKAIAELEEVVKMHPELWSPTNDLAYLLTEYGRGQKDLDRALVLAEKAKSLSPDNSAVLDTLGWINYRRSDLNQALDLLAKAQAKAPENPAINYHLGMAYNRAGNSPKAKEYLRIALASKSDFPGKNEAGRVMAGMHE
ncbi:MAG TPA: tetratricopeptide repeat protein, partial [Thermodesulfovibrionales bacterium]|nr:tetratricopeptide repeat protein [Thermodesulfovibrionales bacterium]